MIFWWFVSIFKRVSNDFDWFYATQIWIRIIDTDPDLLDGQNDADHTSLARMTPPFDTE